MGKIFGIYFLPEKTSLCGYHQFKNQNGVASSSKINLIIKLDKIEFISLKAWQK